MGGIGLRLGTPQNTTKGAGLSCAPPSRPPAVVRAAHPSCSRPGFRAQIGRTHRPRGRESTPNRFLNARYRRRDRGRRLARLGRAGPSHPPHTRPPGPHGGPAPLIQGPTPGAKWTHRPRASKPTPNRTRTERNSAHIWGAQNCDRGRRVGRSGRASHGHSAPGSRGRQVGQFAHKGLAPGVPRIAIGGAGWADPAGPALVIPMPDFRGRPWGPSRC